MEKVSANPKGCTGEDSPRSEASGDETNDRRMARFATMEPLENVDTLRRRLDAALTEIDGLRLTLDVVGMVDLDAAILNHNGIMEALERARRWQTRRGDIYGVLVAMFPTPLSETDTSLVRRVAATIGAGLREVDEVGRIAGGSFAAVLADLQPGSIDVVARRVSALLGILVSGEPRLGEGSRVGAVEVMNTGPSASEVLETVTSLAHRACPGEHLVDRM